MMKYIKSHYRSEYFIFNYDHWNADFELQLREMLSPHSILLISRPVLHKIYSIITIY